METTYKGYKVFRDKVFSNYHISGTGSLPAMLDGIFTKPDYAYQAIDRYLNEKGVDETPSIDQLAKTYNSIDQLPKTYKTKKD